MIAERRSQNRDIAVADEMRVGGISFQRGRHGAFGATVVEYGHDPLETPLLALGHVLLRRVGRGHILINTFLLSCFFFLKYL